MSAEKYTPKKNISAEKYTPKKIYLKPVLKSFSCAFFAPTVTNKVLK